MFLYHLYHLPQVRSWEKQLHQIFDETNPSKLAQAAEEQIQKYLNCLPKSGEPDKYILRYKQESHFVV